MSYKSQKCPIKIMYYFLEILNWKSCVSLCEEGTVGKNRDQICRSLNLIWQENYSQFEKQGTQLVLSVP